MAPRALLLSLGAPIALACASSERQGPVLVSDHHQADAKVAGCLGTADSPPVFKDSEPIAAANPRDPRNLIAVWQTTNPKGSVIQSSASFDGGRTWSAPAAVPINGCAGGPLADGVRASDPWVAFSPDGRAYAGGIAFRVAGPNGPDDVSALVVAATLDGGRTWGPGALVARAPAGVAHDNLALTVDPIAPRTVYLTTTRYAPADTGRAGYGPVGFSRSDDGGAMWSPIRPITPNVRGGRVSAPVIVADPKSGRLLAVYFRSGEGRELVGAIESTDRGMTWSPEITVANYRHAEWTPPSPIDGKPYVLAGDVVQAALDPRSGAVYVVYPNGRSATDPRMTVDLVWSADGHRWSEPIAVADSGPELAWLPAVAVSADGRVGVAYLTASFGHGDSTVVPISVHLRRFVIVADGLRAIEHAVIDRANFAWPGDYQGLLATRAGFRVVYSRSTAGPSELLSLAVAANPTDIFFR